MLEAELWGLFVGQQIGQGQYRTVYDHLQDTSLVLKVEKPGTFHNVLEWRTWIESEETNSREWLAPCIDISPNGRILIQKRTGPIGEDQFPLTIPAFLTDLKRSNWGMFEGRPVAHDYGMNLLMSDGLFSKRKRKGAFWNERE